MNLRYEETLTRQQKRAINRKSNKQRTIVEKLSPAEQEHLNEYYKQWGIDAAFDQWNKHEDILFETMRENGISEKRANKILNETKTKSTMFKETK